MLVSVRSRLRTLRALHARARNVYVLFVCVRICFVSVCARSRVRALHACVTSTLHL